MSRRLHEELTLRIQKIEGDKQSAVQTIAVLEEKKAQLEVQLREFRALRIAQEEKILQNRGIIATCTAALQQKESEVNELYEVCSSINARLQSLQELQKNHEGYNHGVRTIMARTEGDGNRRGIICLIADVLETESRYEKAIEAALEKRLQAVVVEAEEHALSAIEYLHAETGGRVSFIARNSGRKPVAEAEGATSLLSVVKIKNGYEDVIRDLLGDILVTGTLPTALSIWRDMKQKVTIVTEAGDCIDDSGILTGGSGDVAGAGILKRNREIRESSEELKIRDAALANMRREKDAISQQLQDARQEFEFLSTEKGRLDIACIEAEKNSEHTLQELVQERKREEMLSRELSSCHSELDGHSEELATLQEKEVDHQENLSRKASALEAQQAQIQQLAAELEISESGHTDIQVRLASARKELENTTSQLQKIEQQKQAARSKSDQLQSEGTALTERSLIITEDIRSAKARLAESINQNRFLETDLENQRRSAQILDEAVTNHETHMKELQKAWEEIGPKISKAEQDLAADGMHTDYLAKEVFDKYALPLDQLPPADTGDDFNLDDAKARLEELQKRIASIGDVNLGAAREFEELEQRYQHLMNQEQDLLQAIDSLQKVIAKINRITRQKFLETYTTINEHFKELFPLLFNGGKAYMQLTNETDLLETGIEVFAQPPGKKLQSLDLLSGGERALTVIAIMFSIFLTKPTPFCLMDEIDAPLDDSNIGRFITHLKTMAEKSQFIIITHNKLSMQAANSLYGVTMEERGVSKIVSVELN